MKYSLLKLGSVALFVAVAALIVSIACGSSDEEAAPTPDVAKIIQDAVSSVPQGASAAEIQKLVSDSVAAGLAGQPAGVTRADVEAAVNSASAGQLSAADVQRIVRPVDSRPPGARACPDRCGTAAVPSPGFGRRVRA